MIDCWRDVIMGNIYNSLSIVFALIEKLQKRECNVILHLQDYNTPGVQVGGKESTKMQKEN